jgi:hypothetical protein
LFVTELKWTQQIVFMWKEGRQDEKFIPT